MYTVLSESLLISGTSISSAVCVSFSAPGPLPSFGCARYPRLPDGVKVLRACYFSLSLAHFLALTLAAPDRCGFERCKWTYPYFFNRNAEKNQQTFGRYMHDRKRFLFDRIELNRKKHTVS